MILKNFKINILTSKKYALIEKSNQKGIHSKIINFSKYIFSFGITRIHTRNIKYDVNNKHTSHILILYPFYISTPSFDDRLSKFLRFPEVPSLTNKELSSDIFVYRHQYSVFGEYLPLTTKHSPLLTLHLTQLQSSQPRSVLNILTEKDSDCLREFNTNFFSNI